MGKRPNTSMEKREREKTCVVDGNREASTVDAMRAELVEIEAGRLPDWLAEAHSHILMRWTY